MIQDATTYAGNELDVFAGAKHWKRYLRRRIQPYLGRTVLEIGAGIGGTTRFLCSGNFDSWICLEPDAALLDRLVQSISTGDLPSCCRGMHGTLADVQLDCQPETILYVDVLEHIENDSAELRTACEMVAAGGHVVVLSPAHPSLYTPFDQAIGHFRRYTKHSLSAITPTGTRLVRLDYLDSAGMLVSLGNRWVLRSASPTRGQVHIWDRCLVPISTVLDPLTRFSVGKSVLGVWQRQG